MFSSKKILMSSNYFIESDEGREVFIELKNSLSFDSNYISVHEEERNRWWLDFPLGDRFIVTCLNGTEADVNGWGSRFMMEWHLIDGSNYIVNSGTVSFSTHSSITIKSPISLLNNNSTYKFKYRQSRQFNVNNCFSGWTKWEETKSLNYIV